MRLAKSLGLAAPQAIAAVGVTRSLAIAEVRKGTPVDIDKSPWAIDPKSENTQSKKLSSPTWCRQEKLIRSQRRLSSIRTISTQRFPQVNRGVAPKQSYTKRRPPRGGVLLDETASESHWTRAIQTISSTAAVCLIDP